MEQTVCVVTGATSGIGMATASRLVSDGAHVVGVARTSESGNAALRTIRQQVSPARVEMVHADLSLMSDVTALAERLVREYQRLDVVVLNAGVVRPDREITPEGFETDLATNVLGPFLLTRLLRHRLIESAPARVITVTSSGHRGIKAVDLDALPTGVDFHRMRTYATTKLLNVLFSNELARQFAGTGVTANAADPGFVRTRLGRHVPGAFGLFLRATRPFQRSADSAAATIQFLATDPTVATTSSSYFVNCRPVAPSPLALDEDAARRLWNLCNTLTTQEKAP